MGEEEKEGVAEREGGVGADRRSSGSSRGHSSIQYIFAITTTITNTITNTTSSSHSSSSSAIDIKALESSIEEVDAVPGRGQGAGRDTKQQAQQIDDGGGQELNQGGGVNSVIDAAISSSTINIMDSIIV